MKASGAFNGLPRELRTRSIPSCTAHVSFGVKRTSLPVSSLFTLGQPQRRHLLHSRLRHGVAHHDQHHRWRERSKLRARDLRDGRYITFRSEATNLTGTADANGNTDDIFLYDTVAKTTTNITDGGSGYSSS